MAILSSDTFTRANQSGWGTASDGETWNRPVGAAPIAISSNEGTFTGSTTANILLLGSNTTATAEALVRFSMHGTSDSVAIVLRGNSAGTNGYLARQTIGVFHIDKLVGGAVTSLFSVSSTVTVDTFYWIRFRAVSTTLEAKIWADGSGEPGSWTVSGTDSTYTAAGQYGLRLVLISGSNTTKIDSLTIDNALTSRDVSSRTKLQVISNRDASSRTILGAIIGRDTSSRTRLQAVPNRDAASRTILGVLIGRDASSRLRLQSPPFLRDLTIRVIAAARQLSDIGSRVKLSVLLGRDAATRVRMQAITSRELLALLALVATRMRDISSRMVLASSRQRDVAGRTHLGAGKLRDSTARLLLGVLGAQNLSLRLFLLPAPTVQGRDVLCLLCLVLSPSTGIVLSPLPQPVGFMGIGVGPGVGQPADTVGGHRN